MDKTGFRFIVVVVEASEVVTAGSRIVVVVNGTVVATRGTDVTTETVVLAIGTPEETLTTIVLPASTRDPTG
jgi:hypothetical protein